MPDMLSACMKSRFSSILLLIVLCPLLVALSGCVLAGRSSGIEVETAFLTTNQLRLVVHSAQYSSPFYSHSTRTYNVRHYYVAIDLNSKASLSEASTIVGPLWIEKDRDWQAEFIPRWGATTQTHFEQDGQLFKIDWDNAHTNWLRHQLALKSGRAIWLEAGTVIPIPAPTNIFRRNLKTPSGNWQIHFDIDGDAGLFDTSNGRKVEDVWLEHAVSQIYRLPDFGGRREDIHLTDDLKYVVYWPVTKFVWNGRTYDLTEKTYRDTGLIQRPPDYAVCFERPAADGVVFGKGNWSDTQMDHPIAYISDGSDLFFLKVNTNRVEFMNRRGDAKYVTAAPGMIPIYYTLQHQAPAGKIILFHNFIIPKPLWLGIWEYEKRTFITREFYLYSLFSHSLSGLEPVKKILPEPSGKRSK